VLSAVLGPWCRSSARAVSLAVLVLTIDGREGRCLQKRQYRLESDDAHTEGLE